MYEPDMDIVKRSLDDIEHGRYKDINEVIEDFRETCFIEEFFRQHPEATSACISCSCPKCSPKC
jgi:CO dehydrogenase/acetyl-CoA synthase beta subunit